MPFLLYVLLTWTTRDRLGLIDARGADFLRRLLPAVARRHGAETMAIGVVRDHVHVLLLLPAVVDIPRLVQGLKGTSARLANRDGIMRQGELRWARGYDLRSVSPSTLPRVTRYVESQGRHHPRPVQLVHQAATAAQESSES